jgi:glycosyltransferase involved in cell wall biosynthesis
MKAGVYDPYLDTLGGGERYTMTVAYCLAKNGWKVDVFWSNSKIKQEIESRLGIKIERVNFIPDIFKKSGIIRKWGVLRNYDLIFYLSDGSIPFLFGKRNILHFQVPFHDVGGKKLVGQIKLKKISHIVCNSYFTKRFIDKEYGVDSKVICPPVDVDSFKPEKKENIILCVGRFTDLLHNKRQDVLIEGFKGICKMDLKGWKLVLAGGDKEGRHFVARLRKMAEDLPVEIITNPQFNYLKRLYGKAKIFWTAAGFGVNEEKQPEKVEHFGITTVEAMAAGCVPVVINKGGQPEIVSNGKNGLLWNSEEELVQKTLKLIKNQKEWLRLSKAAQKRAQDFSLKRFCQKVVTLLK